MFIEFELTVLIFKIFKFILILSTHQDRRDCFNYRHNLTECYKNTYQTKRKNKDQ